MSYVFPFNELSDYQFKNPDKELFLLPELGSIVNAYAKPRLRYPKTYKAILKEYMIESWPELMEYLSFSGEPTQELVQVWYYIGTGKNVFKVGLLYLVEGEYECLHLVGAFPDAETGITPVLGHIDDYDLALCLDSDPVDEVP